MSAISTEKFSELRKWKHKLKIAQDCYRMAVAKEPHPEFPLMPRVLETPEMLLAEIDHIQIAIDQLKENITYHDLREAAISWIKKINLITQLKK